MTRAMRAVVGLMLLASVYVLALAMVTFVTVLFAGSAVLLATTMVPLSWVMLKGLFVISHVSVTAISVPPGSALEDLVIELAEKVGVATPSRLYLTTDTNMTVRENARFLGLLGGTRTMYIGIPLLAALSEDQLRAVICHELGHYSSNDTRLGAITYRGHVAIQETTVQLTRLAIRCPLAIPQRLAVAFAWLFSRYTRLYLRISTAMARQQELHADAQAAQILQEILQERGETQLTGAAVTAQALRNVHALPEAWKDFRTRYLDPMRRQRLVPDQPFSAFHQMLTDEHYRKIVLDGYLRSALNRQPERSDSHPNLAERLKHLGYGAGNIGGFTCPTGLNPPLDDLQPHLIRAARTMFPADSYPPLIIPWPQWLDHAAETLAILAARQLVGAARSLAPDSNLPALALILELLTNGRVTLLATKLEAPALGPRLAPSRQPDRLTTEYAYLHTALCTLINHALVTTKNIAWSWKISWTGPSRLHSPHPEAEKIHRMVSRALRNPNDVHHLQHHLAGLGLDPPPISPFDLQTHRTGIPQTVTTDTNPPLRINLNNNPKSREDSDRRALIIINALIVVGALIGVIAAVTSDFTGHDQGTVAPGVTYPGGALDPSTPWPDNTNAPPPVLPSEPLPREPVYPRCLKLMTTTPSDQAHQIRQMKQLQRCLDRDEH